MFCIVKLHPQNVSVRLCLLCFNDSPPPPPPFTNQQSCCKWVICGCHQITRYGGFYHAIRVHEVYDDVCFKLLFLSFESWHFKQPKCQTGCVHTLFRTTNKLNQMNCARLSSDVFHKHFTNHKAQIILFLYCKCSCFVLTGNKRSTKRKNVGELFCVFFKQVVNKCDKKTKRNK